MKSKIYTLENCIEEYNQELYEQTHAYEMWIRENESAKILVKSEKNTFGEEDSVVIFYGKNGELAADTNEAILDYFIKNKDKAVVYADEDVLTGGTRINPWFKPEYSPDTLKSVNYFGSIAAVRKNVLIKILESAYFKNDERYEFIRQADVARENTKVVRISFGVQNYSAYWTLLRKLADNYECGHIDKILYHGYAEELITKSILHNRYEVPFSKMLSIIIPSKDNPVVLEACLSSIEKYSHTNYEVIVVDNGSNDENRNKVEKLKGIYQFKYIYKTQDFNFSRMCNLGAAVAEGDILLFLNDDITIRTDRWDEIMAGQALEEMTGAVGAKLYYPDSTVIQHTGITNMGIGPAHKLAGIDDEGTLSIYHARNQADCNVYAVTAAALCVTREKFYEIGGFDDYLTVAYNDVKLCFDLHEHGYYNIVRNDVVLYHHESVSRGSDETPEKKKRLMKERIALYTKHPESVGYDPFYSKHLVQYRYDGEYNIGYMYPFEMLNVYSDIESIDAPADSSASIMRKVMRKGPVCQFNIDSVLKTDALGNHADYNDNVKGEEIISIEGWAGLTDMDECLYDRYIILKQSGSNNQAYKISVFNKYREDAANVMPLQKYNMLLGFTCHIPKTRLRRGNYIMGIMFVNRLNDKTVVYYKDNEGVDGQNNLMIIV